MKNLFFGLLVLSISLSCGKEVVLEPVPCERDNTGNLFLVNTHSDEYSIEIDGVWKESIDGGVTSFYGVFSAGSHTLKAIHPFNDDIEKSFVITKCVPNEVFF